MVRFKNRYLLVSFVFPLSLPNPLRDDSSGDNTSQPHPQPTPYISEGGLVNLLRESLSVNFGDVGAGEVGGAFNSESLLTARVTEDDGGGSAKFAGWSYLRLIYSHVRNMLGAAARTARQLASSVGFERRGGGLTPWM